MTSAPISASAKVANGSAIACSKATTRTPASGARSPVPGEKEEAGERDPGIGLAGAAGGSVI
jgi:hypothetical protein